MKPSPQQNPDSEPKPVSQIRETGTAAGDSRRAAIVSAAVSDQIEQDLPVLSKKSPPRREQSAPISSVERVFGKSGKRYDLLSPAHLLHTLPPGYPINSAINLILNLLESLRPCIELEQKRLAAMKNLQNDKIPALKTAQSELELALANEKKSLFKFRHRQGIFQVREKIAALLADLATTCFQPQPGTNPDTAIPGYLERLQTAIDSTQNDIEEKERDFNHYFLRADELIGQYFRELANIPPTTLEQYLASEPVQSTHLRIVHFKEDAEIAGADTDSTAENPAEENPGQETL